MELWLVRHGTTKANLEGRIQGTLDYPLSERGRLEARRLALRLEKQPFSLFFSSCLLRARQTSQIIGSLGKKPPVVYTSLLQEYNWGILQGLTRQEIELKYPRLWLSLQRDFHHAAIPGAEGLKSLFSRIKSFYDLLRRLEQKRGLLHPVLIVSHGRFLQAFIIYFLKYNPQESWPFSLKPCSISILEGDFKRKKSLLLFNDICHLKYETGVLDPAGINEEG